MKSAEESQDFSSLLMILAAKPPVVMMSPETLVYFKGRPVCFSYNLPEGALKVTLKIRPNEIASKIIRKVRQRLTHEPVLRGREVALVQLADKTSAVIPNDKLVNLLISKAPESLYPGIHFVQGLVSFSSPLVVPYPVHSSIPIQISEIISRIEENLKSKNFLLKSGEFAFAYSESGDFFLVNTNFVRLQKVPPKVDSADLAPLRMTPETRKVFLSSLDCHENTAKSKRLLALERVMNEHYQSIKSQLGIDETLNTVFKIDVPRKTLPFLAEEKHLQDLKSEAFVTDDARNTIRTIRRLSVFQSNEFKMMRSTQRKRGRSIFE